MEQTLHPDRILEPQCGQRALVVFENRADSAQLRLLQPGFRHCFCLVGSETSWTVCDPLKTRIELSPVLGLTEPDLADHFVGVGCIVLRGRVSQDRRVRPFRLRAFSCVEVVRRVLNIEVRGVLTPFHLYRALLKLRAPDGPFRRHWPANISLDSNQRLGLSSHR